MRIPPRRTLRFGAFALGQQEDMWLRLWLRPNFARRNFTCPQTDVRLCKKSKNLIKSCKKWEKEVKY